LIVLGRRRIELQSDLIMAKKKVQKALPMKPVKKVKLEINTDRLEESIRQAVDKVQYWYSQGMINKVRLKYRGKAILPDIPLSYFMLVQVATFFLTGVVRALAINLGTRVFFEVEMINDAEELFKRAKQLYLDGELEEAEEMFEQVLKLDKNYAEAHLYLGIINKVRRDHERASRHFLQAQKLDPAGKTGVEAGKNLKKLMPPQ
jgi:tetratricopeptide (TPR) repeat protein